MVAYALVVRHRGTGELSISGEGHPMTNADSRIRAFGVSGVSVFARATVATLLALAAPAVSFLLTTGIRGSGASIKFPHGYATVVIVTVLVTAAASALGGWIAGRAGFAAIRFVFAWWAVISFAVTAAGISLDRVRLTELGIAVLAAAVAGLAAGLPVAARR
jgi:hypothetical protein